MSSPYDWDACCRLTIPQDRAPLRWKRGVNDDSVFRAATELPLSSARRNENANVELRIVLLHVADSVLLAEFLHYCGHLFGVRDRNSFELTLCAPRIDPDIRILEHVFVPLRIRPLHRQQVKVLPFQHKPDGLGDAASGTSAGHGDFNFAISREAVA